MTTTPLDREPHSGVWIQQARENLGISRKELAAASGFDRTYIWRIETGGRKGTAETIASLANTIGAIAAARLDRSA